jgi:short-subunit dehydrogenase
MAQKKRWGDYTGRVAVVTGASSGIGAALARDLLERGAKVVLVARRAEPMVQLAAPWRESALVFPADITQDAARHELLRATLARFGRVDMLVNNAGRTENGKPFAQQEAEVVSAVLALNFIAPVQLAHLFLPRLVAQGEGLLMNISSPMGALGFPNHSLYNSTKAALSMFSQTLRRETAGTGVQVVDVLPGFTRSEMIPPEREAALPRVEPLRSAEEVARRALEGALRGRATIYTGGPVGRLGMVMNRNLPRLVDHLARYFQF